MPDKVHNPAGTAAAAAAGIVAAVAAAETAAAAAEAGVPAAAFRNSGRMQTMHLTRNYN